MSTMSEVMEKIGPPVKELDPAPSGVAPLPEPEKAAEPIVAASEQPVVSQPVVAPAATAGPDARMLDSVVEVLQQFATAFNIMCESQVRRPAISGFREEEPPPYLSPPERASRPSVSACEPSSPPAKQSEVEVADKPQTHGESRAAPDAPLVETPPNTATAPRRTRERVNSGVTANFDLKRVDSAIVALHQRFSPICEQFRSVRARLISMNTIHEPQVVAVTSSLPREGKSVFCTNLAFVLAEGGQHNIVLIDADFRHRSIAQLLGLPAAPGMADVLLGRASIDDVLQPTPLPNLNIVSAGAMDGEFCGELLGRLEMGELLGTLRKRFDYAILDTPPVISVSDVCLLAPHCDGALLVVQSGRTPESAAAEAVRTLQGNNVRIFGCVMTRCADRSGKYY